MMPELTVTGTRAEGRISPPSSKSHTHRAIVLSALSEGKCRLHSPLISGDTLATLDAVRSMGAAVTEENGSLSIECEKIHAPDKTVDAGNSGTTLRLITGFASLFRTDFALTGDASVRKRPMAPLLDSLSGAGVSCRSDDGTVTVRGPVKGNAFVIDGSVSSQFVSSLLMVSPLIGRPMDVKATGNPVSQPYVGITLSVMEKFGVEIAVEKNAYHAEPQRYAPTDYAVPADYSSAAFPLAAGGLAGRVTVTGTDTNDSQGDRKILGILEKAGCRVEIRGSEITCAHAGRLESIDADMGDTPDLFPVTAVLLATAKGTSRLYGAPHLRFKESDRIANTVNMLKSLGADITETEGGCVINGVERLRGGRINHFGDHRLMMAASVASLVSEKPVTMENDACWNISYPGFPESMSSIGLRFG